MSFSFLVCRIPQFWKTTTGSPQWACSERLGCFPTCLQKTGQSEMMLSVLHTTVDGPLCKGLLTSSELQVISKDFSAEFRVLIWSSCPLSLNMERELGSLILATDISRQNDYLSRFRRHLDQKNLCLSNASHRHFILQVRLLLGPRHTTGLTSAGTFLLCAVILCGCPADEIMRNMLD